MVRSLVNLFPGRGIGDVSFKVTDGSECNLSATEGPLTVSGISVLLREPSEIEGEIKLQVQKFNPTPLTCRVKIPRIHAPPTIRITPVRLMADG